VKSGAERTKVKIPKRLQLGLGPSSFKIPVDMDHMIGMELSERKGLRVIIVRYWQQLFAILSRQVSRLAIKCGTLKVEPEVVRLILL